MDEKRVTCLALIEHIPSGHTMYDLYINYIITSKPLDFSKTLFKSNQLNYFSTNNDFYLPVRTVSDMVVDEPVEPIFVILQIKQTTSGGNPTIPLRCLCQFLS
jgi:hypothetical protein